MIRYFARLPLSKLILWCYLAWYVAIVAMYFDAAPTLWISSVGLSVVIGRSEPRHASILAAAGWLGDVQAVLDSLLCVELFGFAQRQGFHSCISA